MSSLASRFFAGFFDFLLLGLYVAGWWKHGALWPLWLILIPVWFELCWRLKGTPGKAILNIGIPYRGRGNVFMREFIGKVVTWMTGGVGLIPIFFPQRRALHDYIANTDVIPWPRPRGLVDTFRFSAAAIIAAVVVLIAVGTNNAPAPTTATAAATTPAHPWKVSDAMGSVMIIHMFRGNEEESLGSGFLVSSDGKAVTNVHVLRDGDRADVELGDGRKFTVTKVLAYNLAEDVALFQIGPPTAQATGQPPPPFPHVALGSSKDIDVGDKVIVVGSPEGLENTVSEGILSARRPATEDDAASLQVSAPISPGSSGGPVFDSAGSVIGVSQSTLDEGQNLNFAIPVEAVLDLLKAPPLNLSQKDYRKRMLKEPDPDDDTATNNAPTHPAPVKPTPGQPAPETHTSRNGITATIVPARN